jgi:DNA invertase Pin-like site-specific DNA recombinase
MPQVQLPIFPAGTTAITPELAFEKRDGRVVYFNGHLPVFMHAPEDLGAFRLYTSQLIINGVASQRQIVEAFGVPVVTVKRCVKRLREKGAGAFFKAAERKGGWKLTVERLEQAQRLLDQGRSVPQISREIGVLKTTLHKAIDDGRLKQGIKKKR